VLQECLQLRHKTGSGPAASCGSCWTKHQLWQSSPLARRRTAVGVSLYQQEVCHFSSQKFRRTQNTAGIEVCEQPKEAACRELGEESGFVACAEDISQVTIVNDDRRKTETVYFSWKAPFISIPQSPEQREIKWVTLREAERLVMRKNGMLEAIELVVHSVQHEANKVKSCSTATTILQ